MAEQNVYYYTTYFIIVLIIIGYNKYKKVTILIVFLQVCLEMEIEVF